MRHDQEQSLIYQLFECGGGNRWSEVLRVGVAGRSQDGDVCQFSGCLRNHTIRVVKSTRDRGEAHEWFRGPEVKA
jgi:hypothetical protein